MSVLTIITSRKLAVIQMMSYLSCDSRVTTTITVSDSAADTAGRRSSASQKKFSRPQVNRKTELATMPASYQYMSPSAARCSAAISPRCMKFRRVTASGAAQRLVRNAMDGGMARHPCPAMIYLTPGTRSIVIEVH